MITCAAVSQTDQPLLPLPTTPAILRPLDELIKRRNETLIDSPQKSADATSDWLAMNFLFSIACENLGLQALNQHNVILRGRISPSPLSLREFTSMLQGLRELIAQRL
jgi:hypothetical protein